MSQTMWVKELIPHARNTEFFDDISGDAWVEFKKSISAGIVEPLVVTQDRVIVSGHQRRRAALELGIEKVQVEVRIFDTEDEVLKALIETNIRQRGLGNPNPVKLGRCLKELERIEGIQHGGSRSEEAKPQNAVLKTQADLAKELGISVDKIQRYKALAEASPTLQEILEEGKITPTSALKLVRSLSEEEQEEVASQIWEQGKVTGKQVEGLMAEAKAAREEAAQKDRKIQELRGEVETLKEQAKPQVVEKRVIPEEYKQAMRDVNAYKEDLRREQGRTDEKQKKILELEAQLKELRAATQQGIDHKNLSENVFYFCSVCNNFIGNVGGLVWLTDRLADMPEKERKMFMTAALSFRDWALAFSDNLERSTNGQASAVITGGN